MPKRFCRAVVGQSCWTSCLVITMKSLTRAKQHQDDTPVVKVLELVSHGLEQYPANCERTLSKTVVHGVSQIFFAWSLKLYLLLSVGIRLVQLGLLESLSSLFLTASLKRNFQDAIPLVNILSTLVLHINVNMGVISLLRNCFYHVVKLAKLSTTPVSEEKGTCYHFIDRHHGKWKYILLMMSDRLEVRFQSAVESLLSRQHTLT